MVFMPKPGINAAKLNEYQQPWGKHSYTNSEEN